MIDRLNRNDGHLLIGLFGGLVTATVVAVAAAAAAAFAAGEASAQAATRVAQQTLEARAALAHGADAGAALAHLRFNFEKLLRLNTINTANENPLT